MRRKLSHRLLVVGLAVLFGAASLLGLSASVSDVTPAPGPGRSPSPFPAGMDRVVPLQVEVPRVATLQPGTGQRLDVVVSNPNSQAVVLTGVDVLVSQVRAPQVSSKRPCGAADFRVLESRFDGVVVGPRQKVSLTQAGIPSREWPRIEMIDSAVNQDGCKSAQLVLDVHAAGRFA